MARARVEMRLEQHVEPRARRSARGRRRRRGDLGRVVAVVVDDRDAVQLVHLEPPPGAGEAGQRRARRRRARRPPARAPRAPCPRSAGSARPAAPAGRRMPERRERPAARPPARARRPPTSSASDANSAWWSRSMFVSDRDLGGQREDRPVGLVALDDEPARSRAGIRAELRHGRADQPGGIAAGLGEGEGDHRRRRPLAVRSRDDDRGTGRDELPQELAALRAPAPTGRRTRPPPPSRAARSAPATTRSARRGAAPDTACRRDPSRRPRRPRLERAARTRSARRPPIPTNQSLRPANGSAAVTRPPGQRRPGRPAAGPGARVVPSLTPAHPGETGPCAAPSLGRECARLGADCVPIACP